MNYQQLIFEAAASGSVEALQEVVNSCGLEQTAEYAKSQNEERETPLIVAVKGEHYEVVEFLVDELHVSVGQTGRFLWKGVDYSQVPPIFAAIICDKLPCHPIIHFLIARDVANPVVLDSVLSSSIPRSLKIDVLELVGAAYVIPYALAGQANENNRRIALNFWSHATSLRQSTAAEPAIPKLPFNLSGRDQRIFEDPFEFSTVEQLNELANQPYYDPIKTEALLTLRRITSRIDPEPNLFFLLCFFYYGRHKFFLLHEEFDRMIDVVMFILDNFIEDRHWEDVIREWSFEIVVNMLFLMTFCFRHISEFPQNNSNRQELFVNIMKVLDFASAFAAKIKRNDSNLRWLNTTKIDDINFYIFDMIFILAKILSEECQQLKQWLYRYIHFDYTEGVKGGNLLHWTCSARKIPLNLVRLLLEVKANHNALDYLGRTPLHIVASNWYSHANVVEVANLLMDAGSHLNQADTNGVTSLQLFQRMHRQFSADGLLGTVLNLEELIHPGVLPLTCYCAQSIRKHKIPFKKLIPPVVESFVERHGELP